MKKANWFILFLVLASLGALIAVGCGVTAKSAETGEPTSLPFMAGFFSYPMIYLISGEVDISNFFFYATGEAVTSATVIVSNETTGVSTALAYSASHLAYNLPTGVYDFPHGTGESVSLRIQTADGKTISGSPTATPNSSYRVITPASGASVALPFDVTWEVTAGTSPATHSWLYVYQWGATPEGYQVFLPASQTSYQITSSHISGTGNYSVMVWPVNAMTVTGARSGSVAYVGSVATSTGRSISIH